MVETAVLFQTFARPEYARLVFDAIKVCKPKKFYFYSNKAREDRPDEIKRNDEIRSWAKEVDWDCELHTWFREEYVDVYTSLKGSVDWVCENEKEWIVLEDDVVPTSAFFSFCDQMIDLFRNDRRVWYVSGDNVFNLNPSGYDYIFTHYHWMYGWATWRDRWLSVDWDHSYIDEMKEQGIYDYFFKTKKQGRLRMQGKLEIRELLERDKCWDFYFGMVCDQYNAVGVVPKQHLITNIGLYGAHHSRGKKNYVNVESTFNESVYRIEKRPPFVFADYEFDYLDWSTERKQTPLIRRFFNDIKRRFRNYYPETYDLIKRLLKPAKKG